MTQSTKILMRMTLLSVLLFQTLSSIAQISWPKITKQTKPWARWWWEGSAVDKDNLSWNLQSYHSAGLGGLEITPIYGVKGQESRFIQYLSPQWLTMLKYTINQAQQLGMGIDMANATGWPFGGPWVTDQDASKQLCFKIFKVEGGSSLPDSIVYMQPALVSSDGQRTKISDLIEPIGANENLQLMALDQVRFERLIPLEVLMAYGSNGEVFNLTDKVDTHGKLNWVAPAGNWKLYAVFEGWHGKMVERAAPGGEGYAIDHFSKVALNDYLKKFDIAFQSEKIKGIRAFFNDSYEVDDAAGQADFTPQLFSEFLKRRGYDLRDHLPGLLDTEKDSRIISDYRETISDLLLDDFTKPWRAWAESKGSLIRNQSHGSPANILDLYAAVDIPETEGTEILRFKFATSAAHVTGKPLASSESATWLNDHFLSSLGGVKQAIDKYFLGGVNHVFYHGISYSPKDAPWPGWLFYAAVHFNQTNPFWGDFPTLNRYVSRCQSFLQQGTPDDDVLVYYPIYDSFSEPGRSLLKHYDGMIPEFKGTGFETTATEMLSKGFSFDYISDKQITGIVPHGTQILTGGVNFKTLLLPDCKYIPLSTFARIIALAKAGSTILVYKHLPSRVPGFSRADEGELQLKVLLESLKFKRTDSLDVARIGNGRVIIGNDLNDLLAAAQVKRERMTDRGLQFTRRSFKSGNCYFIANQSDKELDGWIPIEVEAASTIIFDPMLRKYGLAKTKRRPGGETEVYLQLHAGESCILQTTLAKVKADTYPYFKTAGDAVQVNTLWTVKFVSGGPTLPKKIQTSSLKSWTEFGEEGLKAFSGTAIYTTEFNKPVKSASNWRLNLGKVYESADVYLNGKKLAILLGPQYIVNIPATKLLLKNRLDVRVSNLMANRIIDMEKKGISYKIFYNVNFPAHYQENRGTDGLFTAIKWAPKPSGLVGPVRLIPLSTFLPR